MRDGVLQQVASPQELYDRPANLFVAEFIGSPAMNLVRRELAGGERVAFGDARARPCRTAARSARPGLAAYEGKQIVARDPAGGPRGRRARAERPAAGSTVEVDIREDMGSEVFAHFAVDAEPVETQEVLEAMEEEDVARAPCASGCAAASRSSRGSSAARGAKEGEQLELAVDTERLHFFDPETGAGIY